MKKNLLLISLLMMSFAAMGQFATLATGNSSTTNARFTFMGTGGTGLLGVGTPVSAIPASRLEVAGAPTPASSDLVTFTVNSPSFNPSLRFRRSSGTQASPTDVSANSIAGDILGAARINGLFRDVARISMHVGSSPSSTSYPGFITFSTVPSGSTVLAERLRIMESGNVGIGTTNALERLHVSGNTRTSGNFITESGIFNVSSSTNPMILQTGGAERMRIVHSGTFAGSVGIGTNNPTYMLDILSATNAKLRVQSNTAPNSALMEIVASGNTAVMESLVSPTALVRAGSRGNSDFALISNNTDRMLIKADGKVGIGISAPAERFHVSGGNMVLDNGATPTLFTGTGTTELGRYFQLANATGLATPAGFKAGGVLIADTYAYANPSKNDLVVKGKVAIGTPTTTSTNGYTLAVNGKIGAHDVQLERTSNAWPDYVFAENYQLPTLAEVERFIKENKHLKDVPSAEEIEKNGYSATGMDAVLLQKVEELTLYILQQQRQIEELRSEVKALKQQ